MNDRDGHAQEIVKLLPRLRRFARALTGNMADADDLVQSACEKAFQRMDQLRDDVLLDRWMFAIVRNAWRDDRRSARVKSPHDDVSEMIDLVGEDGRETTDRRSEMAELRRAVDMLPLEQREVVSAVILEGLAYREAAELLNVPIGTVMSRLSRARGTIAQTLAGGLVQ